MAMRIGERRRRPLSGGDLLQKAIKRAHWKTELTHPKLVSMPPPLSPTLVIVVHCRRALARTMRCHDHVAVGLHCKYISLFIMFDFH